VPINLAPPIMASPSSDLASMTTVFPLAFKEFITFGTD
jgi:hypothetical protein